MKNRIQRLFNVIRKFRFPGFYFICLNQLNKLRLLQGLVSVKFPGIKHRLFLRCGTSDFQLFRNIFIGEEYDIHLPFIPKTIIDGGGNIGLAAIVFANQYPDAEIVTIEPEESNYAILKRNIAKYSNITSIKAGIWHNSSFLNIKNPQSGKWAFTIEETDEPNDKSIKGISIPDIIHECRWGSADLIKLDIEGSEKEIFEHNAGSWIVSAKAIIIEMHDWIKPNCSDAVFKATGHFDFQTTNKGENAIFIRKT